MSGLKNTAKRMMSFSTGKGYSTKGERRAKAAAKEKGRLDAIYGGADLPDDEQLRRTARRKQAGVRGSRASTVLTDQLGA
jgi:hypothetical protein